MDADLLLPFPGAPFTDEEVEAAVAVVRGAAGWHIAPTQTDTVSLTVGVGEALLRLPTRQLVSVDEIRDMDLATVIAASDWRLIASLGQVLKRSGYWPYGYERLEVDMTHGYTTWPADLLPVVAQVAATNRRDQTVRSQSAGVYTVAYANVFTADSPVSTMAALDRYLLNQPGMA